MSTIGAVLAELAHASRAAAKPNLDKVELAHRLRTAARDLDAFAEALAPISPSPPSTWAALRP